MSSAATAMSRWPLTARAGRSRFELHCVFRAREDCLADPLEGVEALVLDLGRGHLDNLDPRQMLR